MIVGIGCDIVEHNITKKLNWESKASAQRRIFSEKEMDIYALKKEISFLSGRFAAKEAILKCLGTGMQDGIALTDILILQCDNERPIVELQGEVKTISDNMNIDSWYISISHSSDHSVAFAIAENNSTNAEYVHRQ